jgi:hypothetical protein
MCFRATSGHFDPHLLSTGLAPTEGLTVNFCLRKGQDEGPWPGEPQLSILLASGVNRGQLLQPWALGTRDRSPGTLLLAGEVTGGGGTPGHRVRDGQPLGLSHFHDLSTVTFRHFKVHLKCSQGNRESYTSQGHQELSHLCVIGRIVPMQPRPVATAKTVPVDIMGLGEQMKRRN